MNTLLYPETELGEVEDSFKAPICLLSSNSEGQRNAFYKLDPIIPLMEALAHTSFIEFPTVEVYEASWSPRDVNILDTSGVVLHHHLEDEPQRKRVKLGKQAGATKIHSFVGDYGSSSEGEAEAPEQIVFDSLRQYSDSEEDGEMEDISPEALLELLKQAQGRQISDEVGGDHDSEENIASDANT